MLESFSVLVGKETSNLSIFILFTSCIYFTIEKVSYSLLSYAKVKQEKNKGREG